MQMRVDRDWRGGQSPDKRHALRPETTMRKASVKRTTKETAVEVAIDLDGEGRSSIATESGAAVSCSIRNAYWCSRGLIGPSRGGAICHLRTPRPILIVQRQGRATCRRRCAANYANWGCYSTAAPADLF